MNTLVKCVYHSILEREIFETRHSTVEDHGLIGLLNLMANILKHNPLCKVEKEANSIIDEVRHSINSSHVSTVSPNTTFWIHLHKF